MEKDYKLDRAEYQETIWYIRQYPKFLKEKDAILQGRGQSYGYPRGSEIGDPTAMTVIRLERVEKKLSPIEDSLKKVPTEYQNGLLKNIIYHIRYPDYADTSTWKRWRRRFVWWVWKARNEQ